MIHENLEYYESCFKEHCEKCKSNLVVHALRKKSPGKKKIIYAHCATKDCGKYQNEIAFIGG